MLESGYIKLYRSLLNWEWYDDINTKTVFLHLLLTVNIAKRQWHGITVPCGSRVCSYAVLASETKLSVDKVRTAIKHLETTGEITRYKYPKCTVFTVNNYDKFQNVPSISPGDYQDSPEVVPKSSQQNKKIEEDKEDIYLSILDAENKNFPPTLEEIRLFAEQEKIHIDVQKFYDYYTERDWKTKNGNFIRNWKKTLQYWGKTEGTPHKGKKQQQETPVSENAEAYASLILNLDEPI
nr:MAG TPA: replisome organizer [Caudoviricetes sp.]